MEPGHFDREDVSVINLSGLPDTPQWSPVISTGKTRVRIRVRHNALRSPQWSPVISTGKTGSG